MGRVLTLDERIQIGVVVASDLEPDPEDGQCVVPVSTFIQRGLDRGTVFVVEVNEMHLHRVRNLQLRNKRRCHVGETSLSSRV